MTEARTRDLAALGAALVTVCFWASAFVGIRSAGRAFSPGALSLGRLVVAFLALGAVCLLRRERLPAWPDLRAVALPLLGCGVLWFGAYNLMLNAGERRVDAGTAAMLVGVGPILIAILAGALLREGFPRMLLAGVAVAFAGVVVIGFGTAARSATTAGIVLCVASAVAYAAAAVAQKVVLRRLAPLPTILLCCAIGVAFFLPWTPQLVREAGDAPAGSFAWIVFLGLFPTALGFVTWAFALSRTDAGRLGATTPRPAALGSPRLALARRNARRARLPRRRPLPCRRRDRPQPTTPPRASRRLAPWRRRSSSCAGSTSDRATGLRCRSCVRRSATQASSTSAPTSRAATSSSSRR